MLRYVVSPLLKKHIPFGAADAEPLKSNGIARNNLRYKP